MVARIKGNVANARRLRRDLPDVEKNLWRSLSGRQLGNAKFRRQVPIGRYVVDFCCLEARLVVELDGIQHTGDDYEKSRTADLEKRGFKVLRFRNFEVNENLAGVLDVILAEVNARL